MDSSKIGIGVIGLFMGKNLLYINRHKTARSEVRAVCDVDPERLKANQEEFHVPFATADYRELIARSDIDVVGIFTPDHLHIQMIREALEAGKHIICTKPTVNSLAEVRETCELVRRSGSP